MPVITYFEDDDGDKWGVAEGRLRLNGHALADAREFADFIYAELAKGAPAKDDPAKQDAEGWIEWSGGECPVDPDDLVDLTFRDELVLPRMKAWDWRWLHKGLTSDIMRYRPSKGGEA